MLYDFLQLDRNSAVPMWQQLYKSLRSAIAAGQLRPGEKLASIRQACGELSVSRTTVETAYVQLCMEGYAESRPQSGYRVRGVSLHPAPPKPPVPPKTRYDFGTSSIDLGAADLNNWKKLVRAVLSDQETAISYGDPQGEACLREQLAGYAFRARGVTADPDCIFIGAGVGPLIQLLCPLFSEKIPVIMEGPGFPQAEEIFRDYGFPVTYAPALSDLPALGCAIQVELPSLRPRTGSAAASSRREQLIHWARAQSNRYILEDDYNGELHYRTRPTPAFQGSCPEKTIYLGSFSKLLLPSVRIAYMVLPAELACRARSRVKTLNQTAGKTEQLALSQYIRTGLLEKHLRRLRRISSKKSQLLLQSVETHFGNKAALTLYETHLFAVAALQADARPQDLCSLAQKAGVFCQPAPGPAEGAPRIALGFSGIDSRDMDAGISLLRQVWQPFFRSP